MNFTNSQTYKNLQNAYEGELKAGSKYVIYGAKAREDGYEQIGNIFDETSHNEREHAELWLKILNYGQMPSTLENLRDATTGEHYEWTKMYKNYAETARKEGFSQIANLFEGVGCIEKNHEERFDKLARNIETDKVFCKECEMTWICLNCSNSYKGKCAPKKCPVCGYPQGYYELLCENY